MQAYLEGYANKETSQPNLWALVTVMAKCDEENIDCIQNYADGVHAFDTTGALALCNGELDMAWIFFREMYLNKKRSLIADWISENTPIVPLPGSEHVLHFQNDKIFAPFSQTEDSPESPEQGSFDPHTELPTTEESAGNIMISFFDDNCTSFALQWWKELAPCYYTYEDSLVLVPRLIEVCKAGSDQSHPFGSSTVKPGVTSDYQSFEEVIKDYNQQHGYLYNKTCNAELISSPTPYLQEPGYSNLEISNTPDSCICIRINTLYNQYASFENNDTSFSAYVKRTEGAVISDSDLNVLRNMCNDTAYCRF